MTETGYLQAPLQDESDIKIFILFLMNSIGTPLEYADISDIVVQNGVVSPFDFCLNFPDLIDSGHIRIENDGDRALYTVTDSGKDVAENLNGKLLRSTKEKALTNAKMLLDLKKTKSDLKYRIEDLPDGRCRFTIRYRDHFEDVLTLSVVTENRMIAERMQLNFENHPETFRRSLMALLDNRSTMVSKDSPLRRP